MLYLYAIYGNGNDFVVKYEWQKCRRACSMLCLIRLFLFRLFYAFCMMIVKRTYLFMQKWVYDESNFHQMDVSVIRRSRCFHVQCACKSMYNTLNSHSVGLGAMGYGVYIISCIIIYYWAIVRCESIGNGIVNIFVILLFSMSYLLSLELSKRNFLFSFSVAFFVRRHWHNIIIIIVHRSCFRTSLPNEIQIKLLYVYVSQTWFSSYVSILIGLCNETKRETAANGTKWTRDKVNVRKMIQKV